MALCPAALGGRASVAFCLKVERVFGVRLPARPAALLQTLFCLGCAVPQDCETAVKPCNRVVAGTGRSCADPAPPPSTPPALFIHSASPPVCFAPGETYSDVLRPEWRHGWRTLEREVLLDGATGCCGQRGQTPLLLHPGQPVPPVSHLLNLVHRKVFQHVSDPSPFVCI